MCSSLLPLLNFRKLHLSAPLSLFGSLQTPALLPLAAYPFLAVCDVYCIYRELKAVQLKSLNRERAELVAEQWVKMGRVPPSEEVSGFGT